MNSKSANGENLPSEAGSPSANPQSAIRNPQFNLGPGAGGITFIFTLWFGLAVILDSASILLARRRLAGQFRSVVAQRYSG